MESPVNRAAASEVNAVSGIGLIAIGSADSHRFYPGMGTLFLRWIGELYQVAMLRCRR